MSVTEFTLKAIPKNANEFGIYDSPSWKNLWNEKPSYLFLVLEVKIVSIDSKWDGPFLKYITLDLSSDGYSSDVFCEELNRPNYIGKNFRVMNFNPEHPGLELRMLNYNFLSPVYNLFIPRGAYHNIILEKDGGELPEENVGSKDWVPPTDQQIDDADDAQFNELVREYNNELKNNFIFRQFSYYDNEINSTRSYWEICHDNDYNNYYNSAGKYGDGGAKEGEGMSANAKFKLPAGIEIKNAGERNNRKGWFKDYCAKKFVGVREAKRKELVKLKEWVNKWREAGNITDLEHNRVIEEWNDLAEGCEISLKYKEIVNKISTEQQYKKYETELNNKIAGGSGGVRADEDLNSLAAGLEKINEEEISNGGDGDGPDSNDTKRRNKKAASRAALKQRNKVLKLRGEIVEWFESLDTGNGKDKYICDYCHQNFNKKTNPPLIQSGKNYCSQDCANKAKGNNDIPQLRTQTITDIQTELDKKPEVKDNELGSYSDWKNKINGLNDKDKINSFKGEVIGEINKVRAKKGNSEELVKLIDEAETKDDFSELNEIMKKIHKFFASSAYKENRVRIDKLEEKLQDLSSESDFVNSVKNQIETGLSDAGLEEGDLGEESKRDFNKLKNGEISIKAEVRKARDRIIEDIGKTHANKEFKKLEEFVDKAIKSGDSTKIEEAKTKIIEFSDKDNEFYKAKDVSKLLEKLSNNQRNDGSSNSNSFPWKIVMPIVLVVALVIGIVVVMVWRKKEVEEE